MTFEEFIGDFYKPQWVKDALRAAWMHGYNEGYQTATFNEMQGIERPTQEVTPVLSLVEILNQKEAQRIAAQNQKGDLA
jgi:hypothetical protein